MLSIRQCDLARTITRSSDSDETINRDYSFISSSDEEAAIVELDNILKEHNTSIDKGYIILANDFKEIAEKYSICPAALFCIYMEGKQN